MKLFLRSAGRFLVKQFAGFGSVELAASAGMAYWPGAGTMCGYLPWTIVGATAIVASTSVYQPGLEVAPGNLI